MTSAIRNDTLYGLLIIVITVCLLFELNEGMPEAQDSIDRILRGAVGRKVTRFTIPVEQNKRRVFFLKYFQGMSFLEGRRPRTQTCNELFQMSRTIGFR